jgi:hypothetical protein
MLCLTKSAQSNSLVIQILSIFSTTSLLCTNSGNRTSMGKDAPVSDRPPLPSCNPAHPLTSFVFLDSRTNSTVSAQNTQKLRGHSKNTYVTHALNTNNTAIMMTARRAISLHFRSCSLSKVFSDKNVLILRSAD